MEERFQKEPLNVKNLLATLGQDFKKEFFEQKQILSFEEYLSLYTVKTKKLSRSAAYYLKEAIDHYGVETVQKPFSETRRFKIFSIFDSSDLSKIIGQEHAHEKLYQIIENFVLQDRVDKLIFLHGPNGSSKSSTLEALARGLEQYSQTDDGAIYKFNWVFPSERIGHEGLSGNDFNKQIGFGESSGFDAKTSSYAHLPNQDTLCKLVSELKENPLFLLPPQIRTDLYHKLTGEKAPYYIRKGALSSKNKKIFDALLVAYKGELSKVLQHIQVERFYLSRKYRTGIALVEPQMSADAHDRQVTMDKNIQNLPTVLQDLRIFEPSGELIDANRGFIEFSDLLKRPVEAFKYLLSAVENMSVNLSSGNVDLDMAMFATANEKHLDAFKNSPDWAAFKGRIELIRVPYLLSSHLEEKIYDADREVISRSKKVAPHVISLLAQWAILTRFKQPDPEAFEYAVRNLVSRITPLDKLALYNEDELRDDFTEQEKSQLRKIASSLKKEAGSSLAYEGRFGASPREIKMILHFAAHVPNQDSVHAPLLFNELEKLIADRSVYDYLQFEPRAGYHDCNAFLQAIKVKYAKLFYQDFLRSLKLFDEEKNYKAFNKYLKHLMANIKNEKIENEITGKMEEPNEKLMEDIERLISFPENKKEGRQAIVARIASWRVENPGKEFQVSKVFANELRKMHQSVYQSKEKEIEKIQEAILMGESEDFKKLPLDVQNACEESVTHLSEMGYTRQSIWESFVFIKDITQGKVDLIKHTVV